jgi:Ca-activated chloride channel family protein
VGEDVNTHFLDKISEVNRGASDYVLPNENIETKVSSFFKKVSEPVMSDIKLDFAGIKTTQVYPAVLPDIFNGTQLIVIGRYQGQAAAKITLTGYVDGKEKEIVYQGNFPQQNPENDFILRLWAIRKIGYLMSEMRFKAENKELVDEIVRLSKEFGIVTPYTSFFVAEESRSASRSGQNMLYSRVSYQAWDSRGDLLREGLSHEASFGSDGNYLMMNSKGVYALNMAQHTTALQKSVNLNEVKSAGVKHEGEKTFYLRNDGWWVDAKYQEGGQVKEVKFMSPEYLLLIKGHPKLGKYFTVAKKVIVVFEGTTYRIIE